MEGLRKPSCGTTVAASEISPWVLPICDEKMESSSTDAHRTTIALVCSTFAIS